MKKILQRFPATVYFILAYAISWGGILWIMSSMGSRDITGAGIYEVGLQGLMLLSWLFMLAGPGIAGPLMTWLVDGREGLRDLWSRFLRWKVPFPWYAAALFIFPALLVAILYPLSLIDPAYTLGSAFALGIFAGLVGGSIEEIGWTGFAQPKLQLRYTPLVTSVILGLVHVFWHLLADYWGGLLFYQGYYALHFLLWTICFIPYRLISVWVYNRTQSLWLAMLTHASYTGSQLMFNPPGASAEQSIIWYSLFTAAACLVAIVIIFRDRPAWFNLMPKSPAAGNNGAGHFFI